MQIPVADQASLRLQRSRIPQTENSAAAENFEYKEIINRAKDHRREKNGASDRNRTGDNHVGNVMLYQLSYTRMFPVSVFSNIPRVTPVLTIFKMA